MLLQPLEFAINRYLSLDPDTIQALAKLHGRVIKLDIRDWGITFFILPQQNGLELVPQYSGEPTTTLAANLFDLMRVAKAKGATAALFKNKITIIGDVHTGEALQSILTNIDIDWEEQLSKITGDVVAHNVGNGARNTQHFMRDTLTKLRDHLKHFLQIESQQLPTQHEVQQFCDDVTQLQHDVERLEAKLNRYQHS